MENTQDTVELTLDDFKDPVGFQVAYLNQIPHPKQCEVLLSPQKNKVIVCGRRSGKSQMIAGELIRGAVLDIFHTQILIAPQYKQAIIVFDKIHELLAKANGLSDVQKIIQQPQPKITFKNGAFIAFGSADNPDSLRGFAYHRVFKDESSFIKKGADNAIKPLTYDMGAPVWETTTPWGKGDVWDRWQRGMKGDDEDIGCFHYNYKDNPYLHEDGVKEIEKDIEEYGEDSVYVQCEVYGNFVEDRDVYFKSELIESCIEEYSIPEGPKSKMSYGLGVDVAGEGEDESVFISVLTHGGGLRVVNIDNFIKNKPREVVGKVKELDTEYNYSSIYLDKTGIGEGPADWLRESLSGGGYDDYRVNALRFSIQSKMDIYSNLKKLMNQGRIKFPNHKKLIFQLMDLRYEIMSNGNLKLHHSDRGHDDYADALALACWACKEDELYRPTIAGSSK